MGCLRRLLFGSPAKSLRLRSCHSFWNILPRRCQLLSVPPFSRQQTITSNEPSAQTRVGLFFCSVPPQKKHPHLNKTFLLRKSKTPPSPCVQETEVNSCPPNIRGPSLSPPCAPTRGRLASFVSKSFLKKKLITSDLTLLKRLKAAFPVLLFNHFVSVFSGLKRTFWIPIKRSWMFRTSPSNCVIN
jgi:hypothetical protein